MRALLKALRLVKQNPEVAMDALLARLCENPVHGSLRLRSGQGGSPRTGDGLLNSGTYPLALSLVERFLRVFTQSVAEKDPLGHVSMGRAQARGKTRYF
jgi:hypothetical protein